MTLSRDADPWRLPCSRALAWALLITGWVGLGSLAQAAAPGSLGGFAMLGLWLLAVGAFAQWLGGPAGGLFAGIVGHASRAVRADRSGWACRPAGLAALARLLTGVFVAASLFATTHGGGLAALVAAMIGFALLVAFASATVLTTHAAQPASSRGPEFAAAAGAAAAWLALGDVTDAKALASRLMLGALAASLLMVVLTPRGVLAPRGDLTPCGVLAPCGVLTPCGTLSPECRSRATSGEPRLFDCCLPSWSSHCWQEPSRWPVALAALVMLPMMSALPLMLSLCRGEMVQPRAGLALHLGAMFAPALLWGGKRCSPQAAARLCFGLLIAGALALLCAPGPLAWWGLVLAHGTAWSVAWRAQREERRASGVARHPSALNAAGLTAFLTIALGVGVSASGLQAFAYWHLAAAAGAAASTVAVLRASSPPLAG